MLRLRHIIIEGPDGAGKTALSRTLCRALGMDYHHEGPPPRDIAAFTHYRTVLRELTHPTVIDRFHLGEAVYGPILRGKSGLAPADIHELNQLIAGMDCRVIVCLPPWETCLTNNHNKWARELIQDEVALQAAYDGWRVLIRNPAIFKGRVYDYTEDSDAAF